MRFEQPFVWKMRFGRKTASNVAHAQYIVQEGKLEVERLDEAGSREQYERYIAERPGSEGLFGPDPARPPLLSEAVAEVRQAQPVWECYLSFRVADAEKLGLLAPGAMRQLARELVPQVAREMGLEPGQYAWHGAVHNKPGQPHAHVQIYQPAGVEHRRSGYLRPEELRRVRRAVARAVYGRIRADLAAERTAARDAITLSARRAFGREVDAEREQQARQRIAFGGRVTDDRLPPVTWRPETLEGIGRRVEALADRMPGHGRAALAYMPEDVRDEARAIADEVLALPQMRPAVAALREATRDLTELYSQRSGRLDEAEKRALDDVRDRVAQAVVQAAAAHQRAELSAAWARWRRVRTGQTVADSAWRALLAERDQQHRRGERRRDAQRWRSRTEERDPEREEQARLEERIR